MSDESRKAILARRATFVAAALAGIACGKTTATDNPPTVCLSVPIMPVDAAAGTIAQEDAGAPPVEDASAIEPVPLACLSVLIPEEEDAGTGKKKPPRKPKPNPRPCLLMAPMIDDHDREK
jgi:hypothetical protein